MNPTCSANQLSLPLRVPSCRCCGPERSSSSNGGSVSSRRRSSWRSVAVAAWVVGSPHDTPASGGAGKARIGWRSVDRAVRNHFPLVGWNWGAVPGHSFRELHALCRPCVEFDPHEHRLRCSDGRSLRGRRALLARVSAFAAALSAGMAYLICLNLSLAQVAMVLHEDKTPLPSILGTSTAQSTVRCLHPDLRATAMFATSMLTSPFSRSIRQHGYVTVSAILVSDRT